MCYLIFVRFRLHNLTYIFIQTKVALFQVINVRDKYTIKYGQRYAGKEKLYARHRGFIIPKASPLQASNDSVFCNVEFFCPSMQRIIL